MCCELHATGAFKRMSGLWIPSDARTPDKANLYYEHDRFFRKQTSPHVIEQVGGGRAGQAPAESARILFWGNDKRCRMCNLNFASVKVQPGLANAGKVVLSTSRHDDFRDGFFVAIEGVAEQATVSELTASNGNRPGYSTARQYRRPRYESDPISEQSTYIDFKWPSANIVESPINFSDFGVTGSDYAIAAIQTMPYTALGFYLNDNYPNLLRIANGGGMFNNNGTQVLTFTKYKITCGTVSGGSLSTRSTQNIWTGIAGEDGNIEPELWLGIGEGYIKTGYGRRVFMPEMSVTHLVQDQWTQGETFWKVESMPGTLVNVSWYDLASQSMKSQQSAGLGAIAAKGMQVLATDVMDSPKDRNQRSSLVTSAQGLIWRDGVIAGINEEHTQKGIRSKETSWPFKQHDKQPTSISVGAQRARPTALQIEFKTTTTKGTSFNTQAVNDLVTTEMLDKPVAIISNYQLPDESGRIGRYFRPFLFTTGYQIPIDYFDQPTRSEWQGVYDFEINRLNSTTGLNVNDGQVAFDDAETYYLAESVQWRNWSTTKDDGYSFFVEPINGGKHFFDGTYRATNVMPDGAASAPDLFYAEPDRSGDIVEAVPTVDLPCVAARDIAPYKFSLIVNGDGYGTNTDFQGIDSYASLPFLSPYLERHLPETGTRTRYRFLAWWSSQVQEHSIDGSVISVDLVASKTQRLEQAVEIATAWAGGYWRVDTYGDAYDVIAGGENQVGLPEPISDFHLADYSRLDDYNSRLASVAKTCFIKSCKWKPKKTQMFCTLRRSGRTEDPYENSAPMGYYGGTVPDADKLELLEASLYPSATPRFRSDPVGGTLTVVLRRTWQVELTIAKNFPDYTPCEIESDDVRGNSFAYPTKTEVMGPELADWWVETFFIGTRTVKYGFSFDFSKGETIVHTMNQEHTEVLTFNLSEAQFLSLESGTEIELPIDRSFGRGWGRQQGIETMYAGQTTNIKFKLV